MRLNFCNFSRAIPDEVIPFSKTITSRVRKAKVDKSTSCAKKDQPVQVSNSSPIGDLPKNGAEYRENEIQIQMLSRSLFSQIFQQPGKALLEEDVNT